jgi:glucose 1-dehydrogenase
MKVVNLLGKVALVTGAARGIGRACAMALAGAGCDVVLNDFKEMSVAEEVAGAIRQLGRRATAVQCDVSNLLAVEQMVASAVSEFGRLDIVVANAAFSDRELFFEAAMEGFRRTIDVTMWGAFNILRAATQQMIRQGQGGSAVVISSPHAYIPIPRSMAYNMAKGAVDQMAKTAAIELIEHRIRVNLIYPGWIDTPGERKFTSDEQLEQIGPKLPWKRLGRPDEIGRGVVFLCDPASDYITGSALKIDGGIGLPWWASRGTAVPE